MESRTKIIDSIRQARNEAYKQHIEANSIALNRDLRLVKEFICSFGGGRGCSTHVEHIPPVICGMTAYLTSELPDNVAFAVFENPNPPITKEEKIKQEARQELLDKLKTMSIAEIAEFIEVNSNV